MWQSKKKANYSESFESLLEQHLDGMYRMALRLTRDSTTAEDLVHDTAVRALRFRERFEMGTHFRAWIYTVLHHTFVHHYRRKKRERALLTGPKSSDVAQAMCSQSTREDAVSLQNTYIDQMLCDDVAHALDALPEEFRMVVTLCDLEGISYKEISEILDCPVGTVMSRLYRGRRSLEAKLYRLAKERGIIKTGHTGDAHTHNDEGVLDLSRYHQKRRRVQG